MSNTIFSIGHSTLSFDLFLKSLKRQSITLVCDVRSQPYSRVNPPFNRELIQPHLKEHSVGYLFLGNELGARSNDSSMYENGKVSYDKLANSAFFQRGLQKLQDLSRNNCVALMCAEREPLACHRTILISRHLRCRGLKVAHILGVGTLETHEETMNRLLLTMGVQENNMFKSYEEILTEAYSIQGKKIAYDPEKRTNQQSVGKSEKVG